MTFHDWVRAGRWGIIWGLSYCRRCGLTANESRLHGACQETHIEPTHRAWSGAKSEGKPDDL